MLQKLSLPRRQFLAQTGAALAALGCSIGVSAAEAETKEKKGEAKIRKSKRKTAAVFELSEEHFEYLVGQHFRVSGAKRPVKMKLVEVREHDHHTDHVRRPIHIRQEPFSLLFIAPGGEKLESGIYEVEHPELGEFNLFLHEVGADADVKAVHYEVVFN
jgi:hypothetical protein